MKKTLFNTRLSNALNAVTEQDLKDIERRYHGREMSDLDPDYEPKDEYGAAGPEDDSLIDDELVGTETRGIKLTAKGLHNIGDGFWYFPKFLRNEDGEPKGEDGIYWYKKKRSEATDESPGGKMIEEYVGKSYEDLPFKVPAEFLGHIKKLEDVLRKKGEGGEKEREESEEDSED